MDPFNEWQKGRGLQPTVQIDGNEEIITESLRAEARQKAAVGPDRAMWAAVLPQIEEALR